MIVQAFGRSHLRRRDQCEAPGRRGEAVRAPRKRQAESEVFIGTPTIFKVKEFATTSFSLGPHPSTTIPFHFNIGGWVAGRLKVNDVGSLGNLAIWPVNFVLTRFTFFLRSASRPLVCFSFNSSFNLRLLGCERDRGR